MRLTRIDVVDDDKFAKIVGATSERKLPDYEGERTRILRDRDFNCGDLSNADLRRVDLTGARIEHSNLFGASLQGASLNGARLQGASLVEGQLQGASLVEAELQGASLANAQLQGTSLNGANLQSADLDYAELQGATFYVAKLQSASLRNAKLQGAFFLGANLNGANLDSAELQGASLNSAWLEGASLDSAELVGATLEGTWLGGASLIFARLQGASFAGASMDYAILDGVFMWRAGFPPLSCKQSRVTRPSARAIIEYDEQGVLSVPATPDRIAKYIERTIANIPKAEQREATATQMRKYLAVSAALDHAVVSEQLWANCAAEAAKVSQDKFDQNHADYLRTLVCRDTQDGKVIAQGIIRKWISNASDRRVFSTQLARGLLGEDGKPCAATKDLRPTDIKELRVFVPAPPLTRPASHINE